jgi:outer membrane protein TolC
MGGQRVRRNFFVGLSLLLFTAAAFAQTPMTRNDVLRHAFNNSESLAQLQAERKRTELMRNEHQSAAFPQINAAFNYAFMPDLNESAPTGVFSRMLNAMGEPSIYDQFLAGALDGAMDGMASMMSPKNALQWELNATQVLFAQGKIRTALRIAETALQIVDLRLESAKFELAESVVNAYNGALMAQQNKRIQNEALGIAEESHRIALARFSAGRGSALDTLNTRLAHQQAILRLREAEMGKRIALKQLATAASMENDNIVLLDSLTVPQFSMTEEQAWARMQENNSNIRLLSTLRSMQEEQTNMARTDYRPTVAAFASFGQTNAFSSGDEFSDGARWDARIGLRAQVPIWDGGRRRSRMSQAHLLEFEAERNEAQANRGLRLALTAAFEQFEVAKQELAQVEQMIVLAEQGFRISKLSFEIGQLTQLELNNSEQMQRTTQLAFKNAVLKINSAVVSIERLMGDKSLISVNN